MSEQRISRKELQQPDRIQQWLYATSNFIYRMRKWIIMGSIGVVIVVFSIFIGIQYYQSEQIKQVNRFYAAQKIMNEDFPLNESQQQQALEAWKQFLEMYPNGFLGAVAWMYLGEFYVQQQQWDLAKTSYQQAIEHPKAILSIINPAKLSLAVVYENQQQWEAAKQVIQSIEGNEWQDIRWKNLARIALMQGDIALAKANLEKLVQETPQSVFKQEAETLLLTLNQ